VHTLAGKAAIRNLQPMISSGLHLPRALLYFSHFGVNPTPCAADYIVPSVSIFPIGYNFAIADLAVHEYLGILR
jgi:uncharacterized SAM-binding protein YcdF (DUF218 family)